MTRHIRDALLESTTVKPPKPRETRPTILLAEADARDGEFGRLILEKHGYSVFVAVGGIRALEIFRQEAKQIDLVIVDLNISDLPVDALVVRLLEIDPNVEVLFSSNYFPEDRPEGGVHLLGVMSKPYVRYELVTMVRRTLSQRRELPDSIRVSRGA
jgi:two-component system, cell cycle sensor histidine kinase and response regulator CckA